jgi:hypothetical protein
MTRPTDRRRLLQLSLAAVPTWLMLSRTATANPEQGEKSIEGGARSGPGSEFDFFLGNWKVRHRRLKMRLSKSDDWEEFDGTSTCQSLLGGIVNLNESVMQRPTGISRGMGIRALDAKNGAWADWYLSGQDPTNIGDPGMGRFANGVGTFLSEEIYQGTPVTVRGLWSQITPTSFQWDQAFSTDGGKTWETNWIMRHTRVA